MSIAIPPATDKNIRRRAMDLLARREHSRYELRLKLRKYADFTAIDAVITVLEAEQLLSEERYAEMIVRNYGGRGYGPLFIQQKLLQQQLSTTIITQALQQSGYNWYEQAKKQRIKHFRNRQCSDKKIYWKQMRYLQNRGFLPEHINAALVIS
ncbi:MAG: regulatory protein RecX [Endozoicomonadaceae bacterium]|nr:regulatory protein RecX [Endozoicomonadaceae bacterium]